MNRIVKWKLEIVFKKCAQRYGLLLPNDKEKLKTIEIKVLLRYKNQKRQNREACKPILKSIPSAVLKVVKNASRQKSSLFEPHKPQTIS